jgi:hypothetical protein
LRFLGQLLRPKSSVLNELFGLALSRVEGDVKDLIKIVSLHQSLFLIVDYVDYLHTTNNDGCVVTSLIHAELFETLILSFVRVR